MNVTSLIGFHQQSGRLATVTAVQPPGRYGAYRFVKDLRVSRKAQWRRWLD